MLCLQPWHSTLMMTLSSPPSFGCGHAEIWFLDLYNFICYFYINLLLSFDATNCPILLRNIQAMATSMLSSLKTWYQWCFFFIFFPNKQQVKLLFIIRRNTFLQNNSLIDYFGFKCCYGWHHVGLGNTFLPHSPLGNKSSQVCYWYYSTIHKNFGKLANTWEKVKVSGF